MNAPDLPKKALASALAEPELRPAKVAVGRLRLWDLDDKHHCPVIGTCLPVDELTRLARRHFDWIDLESAFAMHVEAVSRAKTRNPLSEAMQGVLERRYQAHVKRFKSLRSDGEVMQAWREHYARGDVAGALWAAITHRAASAESKHVIFADVHMLSHQIGAAADVRRLSSIESEIAAAKAALERQKKLQAESEAALRLQLHKAQHECARLPALSDELARLRERLAAFESGQVMVDLGRRLLSLQAQNSELLAAAQRGWALEKTLQAAHQEARVLARERDQLASERDALERLISFDSFAAQGDPPSDSNRLLACDGDCERCAPAVAGQCVLYVGGRRALLAQYRALAGRLGIRLVHHDGGLEESLARLPEMISGADAVVCPTDCVSHSAYYQLKRQCKRSGKPCLLFKGAGVSGFAVALARLASRQFSLPATVGASA